MAGDYVLLTPLTFSEFVARIPEMEKIGEPRFEALRFDATIEMGDDDGRWGTKGAYKVAQSNLVAHYQAIWLKNRNGRGAAVFSLKRKEVENVKVENAIPDGMKYDTGMFPLTSYGQVYMKWRAMYFGGGIAA